MSLESAQNFYNEFKSNKEFASSFENAKDDDSRRQLAKDAGYDFSKAEIKEVMQSDSEISDADLEKVAGGKSAAWIAVGIGAVAAAA